MTTIEPKCMAALAAMALAACDASTPAGTPTPTAAATSAEAAHIAGLPEGQRNGVLFRAIRDAGHETCQQVTGSSAADGGAPAWIARCDDGASWLVTIAPNGLATVTGAAERTR